jgi:hypothetical protein
MPPEHEADAGADAPGQTVFDLLVRGLAPSPEFLARAKSYDEQAPLEEAELQQLALQARGLPRLPRAPRDAADPDEEGSS